MLTDQLSEELHSLSENVSKSGLKRVEEKAGISFPLIPSR